MKADFWSKVLKERGLESPGREEAVKATLEKIAEKKRVIREQQKMKMEGKKK
jgi:hypothetical protein